MQDPTYPSYILLKGAEKLRLLQEKLSEKTGEEDSSAAEQYGGVCRTLAKGSGNGSSPSPTKLIQIEGATTTATLYQLVELIELVIPCDARELSRLKRNIANDIRGVNSHKN